MRQKVGIRAKNTSAYSIVHKNRARKYRNNTMEIHVMTVGVITLSRSSGYLLLTWFLCIL